MCRWAAVSSDQTDRTAAPLDDDDAFVRPAERHGALAQGVLALGAFGVLHDLPERRLPHVEVRASLEVAGRHFLVSLGIHARISCLPARAMFASTRTTSA